MSLGWFGLKDGLEGFPRVSVDEPALRATRVKKELFSPRERG